MTRDFTVQIHITGDCHIGCNHCYITESERKDTLSTKEILQIYKELQTLVSNFNRVNNIKLDPIIHLTGGDPLLNKDIYELIKIARDYNFKVGILGNPTSKNNIIKLKQAGLRSYQLSIDGTKEIHDLKRGNGQYAAAVNTIKELNNNNIKSYVAYNLQPDNMHDLVNTYLAMDVINAHSFTFSRVIPIGQGKDIKTYIAPFDYRNLLNTIYNAKRKCHLGLKDPLWSLYLFEAGILKPNSDVIHGGCNMGVDFLAINAKGDILACRRYPEVLGNIKNNDLMSAFLHPQMDEYRDLDNYHECSKCPVLSHCRGCAAAKDNWSDKDPQCWY